MPRPLPAVGAHFETRRPEPNRPPNLQDSVRVLYRAAHSLYRRLGVPPVSATFAAVQHLRRVGPCAPLDTTRCGAQLDSRLASSLLSFGSHVLTQAFRFNYSFALRGEHKHGPRTTFRMGFTPSSSGAVDRAIHVGQACRGSRPVGVSSETVEHLFRPSRANAVNGSATPGRPQRSLPPPA